MYSVRGMFTSFIYILLKLFWHTFLHIHQCACAHARARPSLSARAHNAHSCLFTLTVHFFFTSYIFYIDLNYFFCTITSMLALTLARPSFVYARPQLRARMHSCLFTLIVWFFTSYIFGNYKFDLIFFMLTTGRYIMAYGYGARERRQSMIFAHAARGVRGSRAEW